MITMQNTSVRDMLNDWTAKQVRFWDGECYCDGIMLGRHIVCGCCGAIYDRDDIKEMAAEDGVVPLKIYNAWVDLTDAIRGDGSDEDYITVKVEDM